MLRIGLIAALLFAVSACGGDDKAKFYQPSNDGGDEIPTGGKGGKSASGAGKGGSQAAKDSGMSEGPELAFTMPEAASNPNDDTVVTTPMVTVRCRATQRAGEAKVNQASVSITVDKEEGDKSAQPATTQLSGSTEEYEAKFDVGNRANGKLTFHCTASDTANTPASSSISMDTLLDLGPSIDLQEPKDMSIHALKTPVSIKFQVDPQPIADGDAEAGVSKVQLLVGGIEHEATEASDKPGLYQAYIDFNDKSQFMVAPMDSEIMIKASNGRSPEAATRSVKSDIKIDGSGPAITIDSPATGSIVHGEVTLKVTVMDASGLMAGTLNASVNDTLLKFSDWKQMGNSFEHTFDTRKFSLQLTQITINVAATDIVGNQTDPPASISLRLDNRPPLIALDPPPLREWRMAGTDTVCSALFDPVGTSAQNDLSTATATSYYRALIVDQTNHSPGSMRDYIAGVANSKVVLYAQPDPTIPLLLDKDGDPNHYCDEINFGDLPEAKRPTIINLTPLAPRGSSYYPKPLTDYNGSACIADPSSTNTFPGIICPDGSTEMFRAVAAPVEGTVPAVYAYNPTNGSTGECEGIGWELISIVHEGWRCLAVRAEDTIGNVGVSKPIRVCFNDGNAGNGTPDCNPANAPSCMSNCTISSEQEFPSGMIWQAK